MSKKLLLLLILLFAVYGFGQTIPIEMKQEDEIKIKEKLLSKNFTEAKQALDSVIVRKDQFLICFALSNSDWLIRGLAGKALREVADDDSVPCLVKALENNQDILSGGSEARVSQEELNTDLVDALVRIGNLALDKKPKYEKIEIERIITESKQLHSIRVGKTQDTNERPNLTANLNNYDFSLGEDIELSLKIENNTNSNIGLFDVKPERSFSYCIKSTQGLIIAETKEGREKMHPDIIMARETIIIEPGGKFNFSKVLLNTLFELNSPNDYILEIKRAYHVESNSEKTSKSEDDNILVQKINFSIR